MQHLSYQNIEIQNNLHDFYASKLNYLLVCWNSYMPSRPFDSLIVK